MRCGISILVLHSFIINKLAIQAFTFSNRILSTIRPEFRVIRHESLLFSSKEPSFIEPSSDDSLRIENHVSIKYCTGCRWMMRSAWMAQELLTTFADDLHSLTLIPNSSKPGGVFCVRTWTFENSSYHPSQCLWDRSIDGGFPESKVLKQRLRNVITPNKNLGHSDTSSRKISSPNDPPSEQECLDCLPSQAAFSTTLNPMDGKKYTNLKTMIADLSASLPSPNVLLVYRKGTMLQASYIAQELLQTFPQTIHSVTLLINPEPKSPSVLKVYVDGYEIVWENTFILSELQELTSLLQYQFSPNSTKPPPLEDMNDDEALEMRKFFGVV
jgi:selenoprotein W-related protein